MWLPVSISTIFSLFVSFSTIFTLIPSWGFLIVYIIDFLQTFEEIQNIQNCPDWVIKKQLEWNFEIPQDGLNLQLLFYELAKFDSMRSKIEGALILCIVAVLAKTCLKKFTPKERRTLYNFTSGKISRSTYLANY